VMLLCVPVLDGGGIVRGFCGMEVSDLYFSLSHSAVSSSFGRILTVLAPVEKGEVYLPGAMLGATDGSRLTANGTLHFSDGKYYTTYSDGKYTYLGRHQLLDAATSDGVPLAVVTLVPEGTFRSYEKHSQIAWFVGAVLLLLAMLAAATVLSRRFVKPINNSTVDGTIKEGDVVIFFNYRNDRAKELTIVLTQQDMPEQGMHTIPGLQYYCMTPYDASFKGVHILFPKENVRNTLGEYLASKGLRQLHTAETEKYAHVTFFFNGGREAPFDGPKVATYDLKPEMSAFEVKDKLVAAIKENKYDFIVVNFANGDMVGHTGIYEAIEAAVKAVDQCVKEVIEAANATDYETIIIADHGNADNAINPDGTPNTAHSLNPVPFIYVTQNKAAKVENGVLADVAPSILHIMGLEQPAEMTGKCLIED